MRLKNKFNISNNGVLKQGENHGSFFNKRVYRKRFGDQPSGWGFAGDFGGLGPAEP
jgi:hypothetical protein